MLLSATLLITLSLLTSVVSGCGEQDGFKTTESDTGKGSDASADPTKKVTEKPVDDGVNPIIDDKKKQEAKKEPEEGDDRGDDLPDATDAGRIFFEQKVLPVFQAKCVNCHADPRQAAEIRGPLTVYSYTSMKAKLLVGSSSKDNDLINKVSNKISHDGADRCNGSSDNSPCKEIAAWYIAEAGDDETSEPGAGVAGRIFEVTPLGKVLGWAYNPDDTTQILSVNFYIDGIPGTGTKIGPYLANRSGADNNTPGNHAFLLDIPTQFQDRKKHTLHAYALVDGKEVALSTVAYEFTAYAPSEAGRAFYNANVASTVSGCGGCHALSYEQHFYALVSPAPSQGGTATNNVLINKAGLRNGTAHSGGNRCSGGNPCNVFQQWWQQEFGTP